MLNVPGVVTATLLALAAVHVIRDLLLTARIDHVVIELFAFIPARYESGPLLHEYLGGSAAGIWTFATYALLHGDWAHLLINSVWLLAFGSAVARRFGTWRFLVFFLVTAVAGAAVHLATHAGDRAPMVGASAAISGYMAAAIRFIFRSGGPIDLWRAQDRQSYQVPAAPLLSALTDLRILAFLAVWLGLNLLLGLGSLGAQAVAWEAHIGGFVAGLVLFALFDPARARTRSARKDSEATPS
jgi:membrane associated rhomboid family serine protease